MGFAEDLDTFTQEVAGRARESNTLQGATTAVHKFLTFIGKLGVPLAALQEQDTDPRNW